MRVVDFGWKEFSRFSFGGWVRLIELWMMVLKLILGVFSIGCFFSKRRMEKASHCHYAFSSPPEALFPVFLAYGYSQASQETIATLVRRVQ